MSPGAQPTEIHSLSLHDALPISSPRHDRVARAPPFALPRARPRFARPWALPVPAQIVDRSEEHTSELQSRFDLVCRLLLEKKKNNNNNPYFFQHIFTQFTDIIIT